MGAQAKGNMADPRQRQMINEGIQTNQQRSQEQAMVERMQQQRAENAPTPGSGKDFPLGNLDTDMKEKILYEIDKRSQAAQKQEPGIDRTSSEYFDLDKFNRLKAEVDQQRSRNNSGIAFGPGRSTRTQYRGNIDLGRELQKRRQRR